MKKKLISSLKPLYPSLIVDVSTGEVLSRKTHDHEVNQLVEYVESEVANYYDNNRDKVEEVIKKEPPNSSPAEYARKHDFSCGATSLPREVKAKSRIERLFRHKLVSEITSYINNPNPKKQPPTFASKINLGAVDKQMASLSIEGNTLTLLFKVWTIELLLEFVVPDYILSRNILKWSLPTVEIRNGQPCYIFSIQENVLPRKNMKMRAGIDFGRIEPFTMTIINTKNKRVADYKSNVRTKNLNIKRERLLKEKSYILQKANHYDALGLDSNILRKEAKKKAHKALILGDEIANQVAADITQKLEKHAVNILAVEDLTWVHGKKYGSKWIHSKLQAKTEHATSRIGVRTKKVNPKNTSQSCHRCSEKITHNAKKRTVYCKNCKEKFDRDYNAAMNIAQKIVVNRYPVRERRNGDTCSVKQGIENDSHSSQLRSVSMVT